MPARYLLDTNICIHIRRQRSPAVLNRFREVAKGEAVLSVISYGELLYGAERSVAREQALRQIQEFISLVEVSPLPSDAGRAYGIVRAGLSGKGQIIGSNDLWIAAHALTANLVLVTTNEGEFRRVAGLKFENWTT